MYMSQFSDKQKDWHCFRVGGEFNAWGCAYISNLNAGSVLLQHLHKHVWLFEILQK